MTKVTKEERQAMLKKCKEAIDVFDDLLDFQEFKEYLTGRNDKADFAMFKTNCFLHEILELFPEDPADDHVEEDEA